MSESSPGPVGPSIRVVPRRGGPAPPTSGRSLRSFLGLGVFVFLAVLATAGFKSYRDLAAAKAHEASLRLEIAAARDRIELLSRRHDQLESDPETLERLAREELGLVRPGDVVIVLPEAEDPPADERGPGAP